MASNPQLDSLLKDLSALDDDLLGMSEVTAEAAIALPVSRAYKHSAENVRALIEKHRIEPEFEWGIQYVYTFNNKEFPGEEWGFEEDPRLPYVDEKGRARSAEIQDGKIWIDRDYQGRVIAVSKRVKTTPEAWETYSND